MSTAFNTGRSHRGRSNNNHSTKANTGSLANKLLKDTIPTIIIVAILGCIFMFSLAALSVSYFTHAIGGWSGQTATRAKQACIDAVHDELHAHTVSDDPRTLELVGLKELYGTNGAVAVAAGTPFYNDVKVTELRGAKIPMRDTSQETVTCVMNMVAADDADTPLDTTTNVYIDTH